MEQSGAVQGYAPGCVDILLVEDSPAEASLIKEILSDLDPCCELHIAAGPQEAFDFLHRHGSFRNAPFPRTIVLDWDLGGEAVLRFIKAAPEFHRIPVIVLSTSAADEDILRGYELHASCWIVKGTAYDEHRSRLRSLVQFWTSAAQLPRSDADLHTRGGGGPL